MNTALPMYNRPLTVTLPHILGWNDEAATSRYGSLCERLLGLLASRQPFPVMLDAGRAHAFQSAWAAGMVTWQCACPHAVELG